MKAAENKFSCQHVLSQAQRCVCRRTSQCNFPFHENFMSFRCGRLSRATYALFRSRVSLVPSSICREHLCQNSVQNHRFHVSQAGSRSGLRTHVRTGDPKGLFRDSGNELRITVVALYRHFACLSSVPPLHIYSPVRCSPISRRKLSASGRNFNGDTQYTVSHLVILG